MGNVDEIARICLYNLGKSQFTVPVTSIDDYTFCIEGTKRIVFIDEDLIPDAEGRIIIDLEPANFQYFCGNASIPKYFEMPAYVMLERKEKRRLAALAKDAVSIIDYKSNKMYFYLNEDKLRILYCGKEVTADCIEIIHGRKAVKAESLELGFPYLELPVDVAAAFERVLREKELKGLCLVSIGQNLLNGREYFRFNVEPPEFKLELVKQYFEFYEDIGGYTGLVTSEPVKVAIQLGIHIPY